jgi:hypothetical protein
MAILPPVKRYRKFASTVTISVVFHTCAFREIDRHHNQPDFSANSNSPYLESQDSGSSTYRYPQTSKSHATLTLSAGPAHGKPIKA